MILKNFKLSLTVTKMNHTVFDRHDTIGEAAEY